MAKMTVYIPDALKARLDDAQGQSSVQLNISAVVQEAIAEWIGETLPNVPRIRTRAICPCPRCSPEHPE